MVDGSNQSDRQGERCMLLAERTSPVKLDFGGSTALQDLLQPRTRGERVTEFCGNTEF